MGYDTLRHRPAMSRGKQIQLLGRALMKRLVARDGAGSPSANDEGASTVAASYAECHRVARAARSNFYYAFYLLPKPKRDALAALYAFMRLVDDVADQGADLAAKQRGLAEWRSMLDAALVGNGRLGHAILPALVDTVRRFQMPARYLHDLILGAEMDLTVRRYSTYERLREYCYRVAGRSEERRVGKEGGARWVGQV